MAVKISTIGEWRKQKLQKKKTIDTEFSPLGWMVELDNKAIVQIHVFEDQGAFETSKKRRTGRYTIFWRTNIKIGQVIKFTKELCQVISPINNSIQAYYDVSGNSNDHLQVTDSKHLIWFIKPENLDKYDSALQKIHKSFIRYNRNIANLTYKVDLSTRFSIQAFGFQSFDAHNRDLKKSSELIVNLPIPIIPTNIFADMLMETSIISLSMVDSQEIIKAVEDKLLEFYERS